MVTLPIKDTNVEKACTRTLNDVKGTPALSSTKRSSSSSLFVERWARTCVVLEVVNVVPGHHRRVLWCTLIGSQPAGVGSLSYFCHFVLGLDEVDGPVLIVTEKLGTRSLTTPFVFSGLALDVNASLRRLNRAFLRVRTCVPFPAPDAERTWHDSHQAARFAALAELALCLRCGLARVLHISGDKAVRGVLPREAELVQDFPATHFEALIAHL